MKYVLVKSADCTLGCIYRNVSVGGMINTYRGTDFPTTDINIAMSRASHFNEPTQPCKCKVEVKEIEE